ncbi:MAG TPA: endonuclease/exonuclease/phosphatase family protein [Bacteroidales bacterium]|nr:endonuclease/exonuclease/phosphatase family protein [Bacteroidales bacterium]
MKKVLYKILLVVNAFFAFTLLMSYLAVHINPEDFALPAFFGLAYPYLLLINIILVIIWAALLKFEALISVVVIAIGFTHFSNYINIRKPAGNKADTFSVLSYNVRLFNYFENRNNTNSEKKVMGFIKAQKPDIICLQEFFIIGNQSEKEAEIKNALGGRYYSHIKVIGTGKNRLYGIATFSKYPIIRRGEIIHPKSSSLSIYSDILIMKDTFRIYNNHLQSFRLKRMERSFIEEIVVTDEKETMNTIMSLSISLKKGFVRRAQQSQAVKEHINRSPYPVIISGDFNDTPVSYSYRKIRKGLNDSFVNSGYGAGFTYKGNYPPNRIDYILYDNALINNYFEIVKVRYSDHYPIIAYFREKD